jgi:Tfp pilus assembly protein PilW
MTERILGSPARRRKRLVLFVPLIALAALILAIGASAGPVSVAAHFEGDDGNLVVNTPATEMDWNGFKPTTWTGDSPYRQSTKVASGWTFTGIEDAQNDGADTVFAGGTKQDNACAKVQDGPKPPNKDDLKRIYIASKTIGTGSSAKTYLALAWARIPQNTTSSSAHVAFEFNQNDTACGGNSDGLVERSTANGGDMLIVYDFEGGSSPVVLKLLRWQSTGTCESTGKSAATTGPCWVFQLDLTAGGFGEAKVNTEDALDEISPAGNDTLHTQEFGEAIINLTGAGVFPTNPTTCLSFGRTFGVSRSSGNSAQAQMKDLVGPADINITNCATVIIRKVTSPAGDTTTTFGYTTNVETLPATTTSPFSLKDGEDNTIESVKPATARTVTETAPGPLYALTNIDCSAGDVTPTSTSTVTRTVTFDIASGQTLDCTFTNTKQKVESSMTTTPWVYPNDQATVGQSDATGSVTFKLFGATNGVTPKTALENCQANGATGLLYSESVNLPASSPNTVNTSNPGTTGTPNAVKVESTATVYWRVDYSGDSQYLGRLSDCAENINATLNRDTGPGTNVP